MQGLLALVDGFLNQVQGLLSVPAEVVGSFLEVPLRLLEIPQGAAEFRVALAVRVRASDGRGGRHRPLSLRGWREGKTGGPQSGGYGEGRRDLSYVYGSGSFCVFASASESSAQLT